MLSVTLYFETILAVENKDFFDWFKQASDLTADFSFARHRIPENLTVTALISEPALLCGADLRPPRGGITRLHV